MKYCIVNLCRKNWSLFVYVLRGKCMTQKHILSILTQSYLNSMVTKVLTYLLYSLSLDKGWTKIEQAVTQRLPVCIHWIYKTLSTWRKPRDFSYSLKPVTEAFPKQFVSPQLWSYCLCFKLSLSIHPYSWLTLCVIAKVNRGPWFSY